MTARRTGLLLLGILGLALLTRAPALFPSLWLDEAWSVREASRPAAQLIETLPTRDAHPPLYYLTLGLWLEGGRSEAWIRGLSLLAGLFQIGVLYLLGTALCDRRAGLFAAALGAVCYRLTIESAQARSFAMFNLLATGAWLFLVLSLRHGGWWRWAITSVLVAAGCYTFYYGFHAAAALCAFGLAARPTRRQAMAGVATMAGAALLFAPWLPSFIDQLGVVDNVRASTGEAFDPTLYAIADDLLYGHAVSVAPWGGGPMHYVVLPLVFLFVLRPKLFGEQAQPAPPAANRPWLRATLWLCAVFVGVVLVAALSGGGFVHKRYATFLSSAWCVVGALLLRRMPQRWMLLMLGVVLCVGGAYATRRAAKREYANWRDAAAHVRREAQTGDALWFVPAHNAVCFDYYAPDTTLPRVATLPAGPVWLIEAPARSGEPARKALEAAGRAPGPVVPFRGIQLQHWSSP